jgi:hypothetical protein
VCSSSRLREISPVVSFVARTFLFTCKYLITFRCLVGMNCRPVHTNWKFAVLLSIFFQFHKPSEVCLSVIGRAVKALSPMNLCRPTTVSMGQYSVDPRQANDMQGSPELESRWYGSSPLSRVVLAVITVMLLICFQELWISDDLPRRRICVAVPL